MLRELSFNPAFVTCLTCDMCYSGVNGLPTYCQKGIDIDPREILDNMNRAAKCPQWYPRKIGRVNCSDDYPSYEHLYEKDSMA